MKIKYPAIFAFLCLTPYAAAGWFPQTPLQPALQFLAEKQPVQSFQALEQALNQHNISPVHWQPVMQAILSQTRCGQSLTAQVKPPETLLTLSFISHASANGSDYQVRLSAAHTDNTQHIELLTPARQRLLQGEMNRSSDYQEIEITDLLTRPATGVYQLVINGISHPVIIPAVASENWLKVNHDSATDHLQILPPATIQGCAPPVLFIQWFDRDYNMAGQKQIFYRRISQNHPDSESPYRVNFSRLHHQLNPLPPQTRHVSAAMIQKEYQQGLKIQYVRRVSLSAGFTGMDSPHTVP